MTSASPIRMSSYIAPNSQSVKRKHLSRRKKINVYWHSPTLVICNMFTSNSNNDKIITEPLQSTTKHETQY